MNSAIINAIIKDIRKDVEFNMAVHVDAAIGVTNIQTNGCDIHGYTPIIFFYCKN